MKKSLSALCALPILLAAGVLSLSSCAETLMNATSDLVVVSPQSRLYTGKPTLEFRSSNILSATLATSSGTAPLTMTDKAVLTASQTGLNVLEITEKDSGGKTLSTVTVNYFVNDLPRQEAEVFSALPGSWTVDGQNGLLPTIVANQLSILGGSNAADWGRIYKTGYDANVDTKVISKIDVLKMAANSSFVDIGLQSTDLSKRLVARLIKTSSDTMSLAIVDTDSASPALPASAATTFSPKASEKVQLYFVRNSINSKYHAAAISEDGTVLAGVQVSHTPAFYSVMTTRCVVLAPQSTVTTESQLIADDYDYYK